MRSLWIMLISLAPTMAGAQPYSTSMAQCAGLYGGLSKWMQRPDRLQAMRDAETAFYAAALAQAKAEGRASPAEAIEAEYAAQWEQWAARPATAVFSEDFRDWASYCQKFANHQGISLPF